MTKCRIPGCRMVGSYGAFIIIPAKHPTGAAGTRLVFDPVCGNHRSPILRDYLSQDQISRIEFNAQQRGVTLDWSEISITFPPIPGLIEGMPNRTTVEPLKRILSGEEKV